MEGEGEKLQFRCRRRGLLFTLYRLVVGQTTQSIAEGRGCVVASQPCLGSAGAEDKPPHHPASRLENAEAVSASALCWVPVVSSIYFLFLPDTTHFAFRGRSSASLLNTQHITFALNQIFFSLQTPTLASSIIIELLFRDQACT